MSRPSAEMLRSAAEALKIHGYPLGKSFVPKFTVVSAWLEAQAEAAEQDEEDDRADDAEARRERDLNDAAHNGSR